MAYHERITLIEKNDVIRHDTNGLHALIRDVLIRYDTVVIRYDTL